MKKDTIFCSQRKIVCMSLQTIMKRLFWATISRICQISNFKCQIEFEKYSKKSSDEMFLCTHNIKNLNHLIAMKKHVIVDI